MYIFCAVSTIPSPALILHDHLLLGGILLQIQFVGCGETLQRIMTGECMRCYVGFIGALLSCSLLALDPKLRQHFGVAHSIHIPHSNVGITSPFSPGPGQVTDGHFLFYFLSY